MEQARARIAAAKVKKEEDEKDYADEAEKQHALKQADTIRLLDYADRAPVTVYSHTKAARAFELFRTLGMRHLCVINTYV